MQKNIDVILTALRVHAHSLQDRINELRLNRPCVRMFTQRERLDMELKYRAQLKEVYRVHVNQGGSGICGINEDYLG